MVFHLLLLIAQVFFGGIIFYLRWSGVGVIGGNGYAPQVTQEIYFYIALGLVFAAIIASYYLYQAKVGRAKDKPDLLGILTEYRSAVLLRDACLQGPSVLAVAAFLVTGNQRYLALTGLIILIFLVWWPIQSKIIADLGLEGEYRSKLEEPDAILW